MKLRAVPPIFFSLAAILALAGGAPVRAQAQTPPWTGIIAPSRAIDWSQAGVPGGIPVRTTVCASIAPEGSASAPVAPTDINAAIASCPAGGVVYLDAGSYYLSNGIDFAGKSDVTLRGAGADQTILYFSGLTGCQGWWSGVCIENSNFSYAGQPEDVANWTGGFAAGTTQITLSSTAGIVPGKTMLDLDQLNDPDTDTGGVWVCEVMDTCSGDGPSGAARPNRAEAQLVLATAVSGNTVTISPGLYMPNWQASKAGGIDQVGVVQGNGTTSSFSATLTNTPITPGSVILYEENGSTFAVTRVATDDGSGSITGSGASGSISYSTGALSFTLSSPLASGEQINAVYTATGNAQAWWANSTVMGDGIESLTVDESAVPGTGMTSGIAIDNGYGNWVSGVRVLNTARNHVWIVNSAHTTIQNSYFYGTKNATDLSYGVEEYLGSDNLIENNIFQHIVAGVMLNGASVGTVAAYNYTIDDYYTTSTNYMMAGIEPHGAAVDFDLFEGNVSDSFDGDDIHGPQYLDTLFRNRLYGADLADLSRTNHTVAVELDEMHRFFNVIGNVLGDPGFTVNYAGADPTIYMLGETDWSAWNAAPDALTTSTLLRWGNYDTVNAATEWSTSDVPTSLTGAAAAFDNSAPASQTLPASFFLSSKPSWWITPWGTPPWPAIGPDVTGGPGKTGHAYAIPAELCYQNTPNDPNYPQDPSGLYVKLFNAGQCYGQPPAAPSGLTATVQ
jgi:hypothetical protein